MSEATFAARSRRVAPSPTQQVTVDADRMRRQGIDVVDLGAGEPDFPTPDHVKRAGVAAIDGNFTKYTPNAGILELREAIGARYEADYGVTVSIDRTIVCAGGKQALFNVAMSLFEVGDEVVTHAPGWPTIVDQISLVEAVPVVVRAHPEDGFRLHADDLLAALTPRTKAIVINSPGNPTGGVIREDDLERVARAASAAGIWTIVDLCYEQLIHEDVPHNLPRVLQEVAPERSVLVGSLSKRYAMTGWRCGWAIGPPSLIAACNNMQSHSTSGVCSISQRAGVAALTGPQECVAAMRDEYRRRRDAVIAWLATEPRIRVTRPVGAFYVFPDISALLSAEQIRTSAQFASALLSKAHVAVTPGEAFDAPGYLRLSCASSLDRLCEGIDRLRRFVAEYDASRS